MGNKICKGAEDTPWVNFSINCVSCVEINDSENINFDRTDGGEDKEEEEGKHEKLDTPTHRWCCCIPWPRRTRRKEKLPTMI